MIHDLGSKPFRSRGVFKGNDDKLQVNEKYSRILNFGSINPSLLYATDTPHATILITEGEEIGGDLTTPVI
jgi:hypothetical protein